MVTRSSCSSQCLIDECSDTQDVWSPKNCSLDPIVRLYLAYESGVIRHKILAIATLQSQPVETRREPYCTSASLIADVDYKFLSRPEMKAVMRSEFVLRHDG